MDEPTPSVNDIPDTELLRRAVKNARDGKNYAPHQRWIGVKVAFDLGSGYSQQLCRRFGFDPDEMVRR